VAAQQAILQALGPPAAREAGWRARAWPYSSRHSRQYTQQQLLQLQGPPGRRAKAGCSGAWDAVQSECERLLEVQQAASSMASNSSRCR
jgi:hypothetical protein